MNIASQPDQFSKGDNIAVKNRIIPILLILTLMLCAFSLFSCEDNGGAVISDDEYVFNQRVSPILIFGRSTDRDSQNIVYHAIKNATGNIPVYDTDESPASEHEIVFGNTNRAISKKAYRKLRGVNTESDSETRFVIYASGNSVAIAYDEDYANITLLHAVNCFVDNYVSGKTELKLSAGVVYSDTVNAAEYLKGKDEEYKVRAWKTLAEHISTPNSAEIIEGMKALYGVYDVGMISWLANLYEPYNCECGECTGDIACGGGGFYYSNSGRDTEGYNIDAESTYQALSTLENAGLAYDLDDSFLSITPSWMGEQMVAFARSLQHTDGFFYHPTWGPDRVNNLRRGRDLSWCEAILKAYGGKPKYTTPNGMAGESSAYSLPMPIGTSRTVAVSRVAASAIPDQFRSDKKLLEYLDGISAAVKSFYGVGSTVSEEMGQIKIADEYLRKNENVDYSLVDIVVNWFNEKQDPETGLWLHTSPADAIDGVLKIANIYAAAGREFPHAYEAAETAIELVISEGGVSNVVHIYNPWSSICKLMENMAEYGRTETVDGVTLSGPERAELIRSRMYDLMPQALERTVENISLFKKQDGSFSFTRTETASTSCGMPVAVIGTNEGDVNSTYLFVAGVNGAIYNVLGISSEYSVPLFGSAERKLFVDTVNDLGPVQKIENDTEIVLPDPYTFEEDYVDTTPNGFSGSYGAGGSGNVTLNPKGEGKVVTFVSNSGAGEYFYTDFMLAEKQGSCAVYSADVYIDGEGTGNGSFMQMIFADVAMLYLNRQGNEVKIVESSARDNPYQVERYLTSVKIDEWFRLELRYYAGTSKTTRLMWYINGELIAVTNNFFSYNGSKLGTDADPPALKNTARMTFYVLSSQKARVSFDNVNTYLIKESFTPTDSRDLVYNVDLTEEKCVHTFDGDELTDKIVPSKGASLGIKDGMLSTYGEITMAAVNTVPAGTCLVYEMDLAAHEGLADGAFMTISFREDWREKIPMKLVLKCISDGNGKYLQLSDASGAERKLEGARINLDGSTHRIRIEYYHNSQISIYIDGVMCANLLSQLEIDSKAALRYRPETLVLNSIAEAMIDNVAFYYDDTAPVAME